MKRLRASALEKRKSNMQNSESDSEFKTYSDPTSRSANTENQSPSHEWW